MYSAFIYPQQVVGQLYKQPALPSTFVGLYAYCPTWNLSSSNIADRTAYYADTAGTLTEYQMIFEFGGLPAIQNKQMAIIRQSYENAISTISYTTKGGVTKTYQSTLISINNLLSSIVGCQALGLSMSDPPPCPYWVAADNTQILFTVADLQGLGIAIYQQAASAFQNWQILKSQVRAATTIEQVQAVVW